MKTVIKLEGRLANAIRALHDILPSYDRETEETKGEALRRIIEDILTELEV